MDRKYPKERPIAVDFFSGAGGMSLGFEQAGFDILLGVDVDGHHVATHERNFPYGKAMCESIVKLDARRIRDTLDCDRDIDLVFGGPPCQGFSNMGLRDLKDPRNSLIDHFIRIVLELRPKAFVMENVPGLLAGPMQFILDQLIRTAAAHDYIVTLPVQFLDAANFGVPQQRRRVFVLGIRSDAGSPIAYPTSPAPGQPRRPTIWQAIEDVPDVEKVDALFKTNDTPYTKAPRSLYAKVARGVMADPSDLSRPRDWHSAICSGCLRTRHSPESVRLYDATPAGGMVPGHKLPRLHPDGLCPTLRAGSDSTHGSYTAPRPIHPKLPRCITSREAARLHGFPDWFAFYPLKWHAYRQIGNAVCPPVARAIGQSILEALGGRRTRKAPATILLDSNFFLPKERPRTLKRIPQLRQFPPVIAYLFEEAYDQRRRRLRKPSFSFDDVQRAIEATKVNLHWVRDDTFLSEIARTRHVLEILRPALERGFTILPSPEQNSLGIFVPVGTPGALEDKENLQLRIGELHDAERLALKWFSPTKEPADIVAFLSQTKVQHRLWKTRKSTFAIQNGSANGANRFAQVLKIAVRQARGREELTSVITCKATRLPTKARLVRVGAELGCDQATVVVEATLKHLVAIRFDNCLSTPKEVVRGAFELQ